MEKPIIEKKITEVNLLTEKIKESASVVVVDYRGLSVENVTDLRSQLREEGCEIKVIKNNITRRASESCGYEDILQHLKGTNAIAFSKSDSIAAAKILYNFSKTNDKLKLKAGIVDGKYADSEEIVMFAKTPNRETLLTMLAGSMLAPIRDLGIGLHMLSEGEGSKEETNQEG